MKRAVAAVTFITTLLAVRVSHRAFSSLMVDTYVVYAVVLLGNGLQHLTANQIGSYGAFVQRAVAITGSLWLIVELLDYSGNVTLALAVGVAVSLVWSGWRNRAVWKVRSLLLQANALTQQRDPQGAARLYRQAHGDLIARGMDLEAAQVGYQLATTLINDERLPEGIRALNQSIPGLRAAERHEDLVKIAGFVRELAATNVDMRETVRLLSGPIPALSNRPEKIWWAIFEGSLATVFLVFLLRNLGNPYFAVSGAWLAAYLAVGGLLALGNALLTIGSGTVQLSKALVLNVAGAALFATAVAAAGLGVRPSSLFARPAALSVVTQVAPTENSGGLEREQTFFETVMANQKSIEQRLRSQLVELSEREAPPQMNRALPHASLVNRAVDVIQQHRAAQIESLGSAIRVNAAEQQAVRDVYDQWKPLYREATSAAQAAKPSPPSVVSGALPTRSVVMGPIEAVVKGLRGLPPGALEGLATVAIIVIIVTAGSGIWGGLVTRRSEALDSGKQLIVSGDLAGGIRTLEQLNLNRPGQLAFESERQVLLAYAQYNHGKSLEQGEEFKKVAISHVDLALQAAPDYLPALYLKGYMLLAFGQTDEAEAPLRRVVEIDSQYESALYHFAVCLHRKAMRLSQERQAGKAAEVIEEISRLGLDQEFRSTLIEFNWHRMIAALKADDLDQAEGEWKHLAAQAPEVGNSEETLRFQGMLSATQAIIAWRRDNAQQAFDCAAKALETIKTLVRPEPRMEGASLSARLKARREATENKMDPAVPRDLHYLRGLVLLRSWAEMPKGDGEDRDVINRLHEELDSCVSYSPDCASALAISGLVYYYVEGGTEKGIQLLRRAQAGGARHPFVVETVQQHLALEQRLEEAREVGFELISQSLNDYSLVPRLREQLRQKMEQSGTFDEFLGKDQPIVKKVEDRQPTLRDVSERGKILQEKVRQIIEQIPDSEESTRLQDLLVKLSHSSDALEQSVDEVQEAEGSILSEVAGIL